MDLSIVIPTFNEEDNVFVLYQELKEVLDGLDKSYEIIFTDDGSTDRTFSNLKSIHETDESVKIIKFRTNFGQTAALDAGFKKASGEVVITLDADLQNDPKDIPALLERLDAGYDVVSGWRTDRRDPFLKKLVSMGGSLLRKLLQIDSIHDSGCTLKAYRREALDGLSLYGEMHRFIPALLGSQGFKITEIVVNHRPRRCGKTKYDSKRVLKGFLDVFVVKFWSQYSARPAHVFGGFGMLTTITGFIIALHLSFQKFFFGESLSDRPLLLLSVLLIILGVQFMIFGLLADIMVRIYYSKEHLQPYTIETIIE